MRMPLRSLVTVRPGLWAESGFPELFSLKSRQIHEIKNPRSNGARMNYSGLDELLRVRNVFDTVLMFYFF